MKKYFLKLLAWKLKKLAKLTLKRYKPGIIGITGSVGKTSTKEVLKIILSKERRIRAPSKNFNNELGLPLTVLGNWQEIGGFGFWAKVILISLFHLIIKDKNYPEILILEYGIDAPGDMKKLLEIVRPNIGVITAIGEIPVHIEFFSGKESLIREKTRLINGLPATGFVVLNSDDKSVINMKKQTRAHVITFGFADSADVRISNFDCYLNGKIPVTFFKLNYGGSFVPVKFENILGKSQAYAIASAAAVAVAFGINLIKVVENSFGYFSPPGRLKILPGVKDSLILDDTYNSSPLATKEALEVLKKLKSQRKIAVLGDMLELGSYTVEAHEEIGRVAAKSTKILFTIGNRAKFIAESAILAGLPKKSVFIFNKITDVSKALQEIIQPGDLILVKGSQSVRLEKTVKEIMDEPDKAAKILVRQSERWLQKPGLYD